MTVGYNTSVPVQTNSPSVDQPEMTLNTQAIATIIAVDHVGFNSSGNPPPASNGIGGTHLQVTFNGKNTPGAQTDPQSVLYTKSGVASSVADMAFVNQNGTFIQCIRAWGAFTSNTINNSQSMNVSSIVRTSGGSSAGDYTVTLTTNAVNSANFAVVMGSAQFSNKMNFGYSITGTGIIRFRFFNDLTPTDPGAWSFIALQI